METTTLKQIDLNKGFFEANGKKYFIESTLSIERYCEFQILEKELGFGTSFKAIYESLNVLWTNLNKMQFAEAAVTLNNLMRGFAKIEEREPTILKICALYINEEKEDRSAFSQDMLTRKIEDWKTEGYEMKGFFSVAFNSVNGFLEIYNKASRIISGMEKPGQKA